MMLALLEEKGIKALGPGRQSVEFVGHKSSQNIITRCLLYAGWHYVQGTGDRWRSTQNGSKIKFSNHLRVHRSHSKQKVLDADDKHSAERDDARAMKHWMVQKRMQDFRIKEAVFDVKSTDWSGKTTPGSGGSNKTGNEIGEFRAPSRHSGCLVTAGTQECAQEPTWRGRAGWQGISQSHSSEEGGSLIQQSLAYAYIIILIF